jgi:hypothetical protein
VRHAASLCDERPIFVELTASLQLAFNAGPHHADFFDKRRARRWPFHIQNPDKRITGRKKNRTAGA